MIQTILHLVTSPTRFDGATYDSARDQGRLNAQLSRLFAAMSDGGWHTLDNLASEVGASSQSVSARLRDLRKARFGGHTIERRYASNGLFEYRLL